VIASTFKAADDEEYILEAIRFVQDEVRYLGVETGINTHKPYPPSQILAQRFGDCKDKSLLLTTLLQARNIEAYPVLVNTSLKQSLDESYRPALSSIIV
jgi:transglutaminase-like putative cysteine protease